MAVASTVAAAAAVAPAVAAAVVAAPAVSSFSGYTWYALRLKNAPLRKNEWMV